MRSDNLIGGPAKSKIQQNYEKIIMTPPQKGQTVKNLI
jgi:hypothetical protein